MYFNEKRENTNIDDQFRKNVDLTKLKFPLIIIGAIILLLIIIAIIVVAIRNKTKYYITLEGDKIMTIYEGSTYIEMGYEGHDNKNKTYDVTVTNNVDTTKVGTYTITYKLYDVTETRTVNVIEPPTNPTVIHLNGERNIYIKVGDEYTELGYSAVDYIDGDLTDKVTIKSNLDVNTAGVYRVIYAVVNSQGVTTTETRMITVE